MPEYLRNLAARIHERFGDAVESCRVAIGELTLTVPKHRLIEVCRALRDEPQFALEELVDLSAVDYLEYRDSAWQQPRFGVAYHLLSVTHNWRVRVKVFVDGEPPVVDSVVGIWASANWYEREAFDLFGIVFDGHPDLRRILTDYGFVGHPFRKDFPLIGNVEMRYDPERRRVVYEPVSIEPRVTQPRVIREDHRYVERLADREAPDA
jgi:NADH-quinone oxidoreductase subunit C